MGCILLFALAIRVGYLFFWRQGFLLANVFEYNTDGAAYMVLAENIVQGNGFANEKGPTAFVMPLYPLFISFTVLISNHSFFLIRIIQALIFLLVIILYYKIYQKIFNNSFVALLSILLLAIFPSLIHITGRIGTQTLEALGLALLLYFFVNYFDGFKFRYLILGSISLSFAILIKPAFSFVLPLILVILWFAFKKKQSFLKSSLILIFILLILLSPWTIRNYLVFKAFIPLCTEGGWNLYSFNNRSAYENIDGVLQDMSKLNEYPLSLSVASNQSELIQDSIFYKEAFQFIAAHPAQFIRVSLYRVYLFWRLSPPALYSDLHKTIYVFFDVPVIIFGFFGLIVYFRKNGVANYKGWILVSPLIVFTGIHAITLPQEVYRIHLMPIVIGFAVYYIVDKVSYRLKLANKLQWK